MKKLFATFLALVMVLSSLCLPAVADTTNTSAITLVQADFTTADTNDYDGDENTTEMLVTAKVEKAMADAVAVGTVAGAYKMPEFVLGGNIVIEVTAANQTTVFPLIPVTFQGILNGNGNTISFTYTGVTAADISANNKGVLFNLIGGWDKKFNADTDDEVREIIHAQVKNLTIDGAKFTSSGTAGAQHGVIASGTKGTVVFTDVDIINTDISKTASNNRNIGGYIGNVASTVTFVDCSFGGKMAVEKDNTSGASVGGFIGRDNGSGTVTFTDCSVLANSEISGYANAGGFVAYDTTTNAAFKFNGTNVMNASVSAVTNAGGVIGYIDKARSTTAPVQITDTMLVTGSVEATGETGHAGGVIGNLNTAYTALTTHTMEADIIIKGVTVTGDVTSGYRAGGILGDSITAYTKVLISDCINMGDVSGVNATGGIMGGHGTGGYNTFTIDGCVNTGTVESSGHRAGGIAAHIGNSNGTVTMTDCINFGHIESTYGINAENPDADRTAPTAGSVNSATLYCMISTGTRTVENCVNFGTRTGWTSDYKLTTDPGLIPTGSLEGNIDFTATNAGTTAVLDSALLAMGEEGKAQMRYSNTLTDAGIRFKIDTNSALLTALTNAGYTYTLGSLMATKATATEAGALTKAALEGKLHSDVNTGAVVKDNQYAVAVNNIGADYYATEFQCAGYITLTKGNTTYTIYTEASEARSLAYVADAILDKNEETAAIEKYGATLAIFQAALPTE